MSTISRKAAKGIALAAASALVLAGCAAAPEEEETADSSDSGSSETETETETEVETVDYKACMVSDEGGFDDASFNEEAFNGLQRAEDELGIETAAVESNTGATLTEYSSAIESLVGEGCDMVFGVGFALATAVRDAAIANPDTDFALIDSALSNDDFSPLSLENVKPIQYDTAEAAFLAGYLAAGTTETGTLATYGGILFPTVTIFMDGFKQGVDYYNEQNGTEVAVLGASDEDQANWSATGDFSDIAKGKNLSEQFIDQGADIILPVAGPVGQGTGQASLDSEGTLLIGVDSDWYNLDAHAEYKQNILTSVEKKMSDAVFNVIQTGVDGTFTGGDENQYVGNLANGGVRISPEHEVAYPDGIQAELDSLADQIIAGELVVNSIYKN